MSVGESPARFDAADKVTGDTRYSADRVPHDALFAHVVFTAQPHAELIALDVSEAEACPGVVTVVTAADVPRNEYGLTRLDQPVFVNAVDDTSIAFATNVSRWEADHLCAVVAETAAQARHAASRIRAEWKPLRLVPDLSAAKSDEILVHTHEQSNTYHHLRIRRGDIDAGWAAADVVIEGTYELPYQEHAYLQPEAGTAWIDEGGRVVVEVGGQWAHEDREQIAHALGLEQDEVRVIYPPIGGAFGGREDLSLQIVLAVAARKVVGLGIARPVTSQWSREESIVGHHKRHRAEITARIGATVDGKITAVEADVWLDAGAYNYTSNKVLGNAHLSVAGPYEIPNARIDSRAVYTTSPPGGAFRGFGGPQGGFVAETQMNRLAEALGIDPVELRRRNIVSEGSIGITGAVLPQGVTIGRVIEACAERAAEPAKRLPFSPFASLGPDTVAVRNGRGFAAGSKNVGFSFGFPERCEAEVHLYPADDDVDGEPARAELFHAGAEVGQGAHQAFLQMAAEATGLAIENITGHFGDTANTGDAGSSSASRMTFMAGNSIIGAADLAAKAWVEGQRPAIGWYRFVPPETEVLDENTGEGQPNFAYGYMATAVDITVDTDTGHIRVDRVIAAHDVGRAINPTLLRGQIEGAVAQAHGYTLSENLIVHDGQIQNPRLSSYLIPGIGDVPAVVDSVVLELGNDIGPFGAIGVAEMPFITYAPAVIAAVHDATGVWFDALPLTPARVLAGLRSADVATDS